MANPQTVLAEAPADSRPGVRTAMALIWAMAIARFCFHRYFNNRYGYFRVVWNQLSPEERQQCAIFGQDYGQAGAIDFLGRQ